MKSIKDLNQFLLEKNLIINSNIKDENIEIKDITYDSRKIVENSAFICKGENFKFNFLDNAIENGAKLYISEIDYNKDISSIIVKDIRIAMLELARFFFDYPDKKLKLIGVTGTKGKSTTVYFAKQILDYYLKSIGKKEAGLISGIETYDGKRRFESTLTTPEAIELYRILNNCVKSNIEYAIIEISSQALKYERINNVEFDAVALLNISIDHIGTREHPTYEDYVESKLKIFDLSDNLYFSLDSAEQEKIKNYIGNRKYHTFSVNNDNADYTAKNIKHELNETKFEFLGEDFSLVSVGDFNIENACCAILLCRELDISPKIASKALKLIDKDIRSDLIISNNKKIISFVNYAHNVISFEKTFEMVKDVYKGYNIISVFGAAGGKAINRRKDLTTIADKYSDKIIFVPDDPNFENTIDISKIMASYVKHANYEIFETREDGIKRAFEYAKVNNDKDWLLFIAGKHTETYQLKNGGYEKIIPDTKVARKLMNEYNTTSK